MKFVGIIPARYASTRFPGKPLAMLGGKPVIQRVYEQAKDCFDDLYVATDDERILEAVKAFGGNVVTTRLQSILSALCIPQRRMPTARDIDFSPGTDR